MDVDRRCLELIEVVYDLRADLSHLVDFLECVYESTGAIAMLRSSNQETGEGRALLGSPMTPLQLDSYSKVFHPAAVKVFQLRNPLFTTEGKIATQEMALPIERFEDSELGQALAKENVLQLLNAVIEVDGPVVLSLTLIRAVGSATFTDETYGLVERLLPHLRRSIRLSRRLERSAHLGDALAESLDYLPMGFLLCTSDGQIVQRNRGAREILAADDGLLVDAQDRLSAYQREDARALADALHCVAHGNASQVALPVQRAGPNEPYSVLVLPVGSSRGDTIVSERSVALFVRDPARTLDTSATLLCTLYGFTPAEARLARSLLRGETLESASSSQGISVNTGRTHLQRLFEKTNTHRQSELVALLLGGVAALRVLDPKAALQP